MIPNAYIPGDPRKKRSCWRNAPSAFTPGHDRNIGIVLHHAESTRCENASAAGTVTTAMARQTIVVRMSGLSSAFGGATEKAPAVSATNAAQDVTYHCR